MAYATEVHRLPSNGVLDGIPKEITIRNMRTAEEKMLLGSSEDAYDDIIQSCIMDEGIDFDAFTAADKFFTLVKLRVISYGPEYYFRYQCPFCGKTYEYCTNLDEQEVYYLPDDFKEPYDTFPLPLSKDTVALKLPRLRDIKSMRNKVRRYNMQFPEAKGDITLIYGMATNIATVNAKTLVGNDIIRYLEDMPVRDSSYIRNRISRLKIGMEARVYETCKNPRCKEALDIPLSVGYEFFRTREGE